jgi:D-aminopeptidase
LEEEAPMPDKAPEESVSRPRARDLGLPLPGTPGPNNAITDVAGVEVGFATIKSPAAKPGDRQVYTGVTAVLPRGRGARPTPVWAGQFDLRARHERDF